MAGLTPAEAYTVMQGTDTVPAGLTSIDNSGDPDTQYTHASCLLLEGAGGCVRSWGGQRGASGAPAEEMQTFVVWLAVPDFTAFPPPPAADEEEAQRALPSPEPELVPADEEPSPADKA